MWSRQRVKYLQLDEAVEHGLIDRVISKEDMSPLMKPSFMYNFNYALRSGSEERSSS